jgi:hypothetical protein
MSLGAGERALLGALCVEPARRACSSPYDNSGRLTMVTTRPA